MLSRRNTLYVAAHTTVESSKEGMKHCSRKKKYTRSIQWKLNISGKLQNNNTSELKLQLGTFSWQQGKIATADGPFI